MQKRVLAFLLVMVMVFSLLPVALVGAETETATPAYAVIFQKAHNQTEGSLAVDVYLQATVASEITGYELTVTPAEGLAITGAVDATGNDGLAGSGNKFVYTPGATPLTVGTARVLVATITLTGETLPEDVSNAFTVTDPVVTTADAPFTPELSALSYACTDEHTCGHSEGTWTALDQAELDKLYNAEKKYYALTTGNYYLTSDITLANKIILDSKGQDVSLCLNGYTVTGPDADRIFEMAATDCVMDICDCTATGEGKDLVAGKFVIRYANWGVFRQTSARSTLYTHNVILEGAEDAVFTSTTNSGVGNACTFYQGTSAAGSYIYAEDVLIKNIHAGKTVIDTRAEGYYKNVTFVNCKGGQNSDTDPLAIFATNGSHASSGTCALTIEDCKFIDCDGDVLDTNAKKGITFTVKGNTWADGDFFVNGSCKLNLDLGANAKVNIRTQEDKTPETFGDHVVVPEGATLTTGTVLYQNAGSFVGYKDGAFTFDSHAHDDVGFKAWNDSTNLPTEGNYYLACDVNLAAEKTIGYGNTLNLCLNGHTIKQTKTNTRVYWVNGVLNLYDCAEEYDADGNWTGGVITGAHNSTGGCIRVARSQAGKLEDADRPTFNMYGGRLAGNGNTNSGTSGGAVYITSSRSTKEGAEDERGGVFNMYGGELYDNHTATLGGAVTVWGLSTTRSGTNKDGERRAVANGLGATFNMYGGKIHGNSSGDGGAIRVYNTDAELNIEGGEIYNNTADRGGAIAAENVGKFAIKNAVITGNSAKEESDVARNHYGSGGAIYLYNTRGTEATITDTVFDGNSAYRKQKGTNGSDYAALGGAIYSYTTNLRIEGCEFTNNTTNNHGAALVARADGGYTYVKDTNITGNTSTNVGGAIYFLGKNTTTFDSCNITGNTSSSGAVYVTSATSRLVIAGDTVIAGNIRKGGNNNQQDIYFQAQADRTNLMEVNEMTAGAHVNVYHYHKDSTINTNDTADGFVRLSDDNGTQTDWESGWVTVYTTTTDAGRNVSYLDTDGDGTKEFTWGHYHKDAQGNLVEYTEWTATTAPTEAGNYYLADDVKSTATWSLKADMHICFNGKVLTSGGTYTILLDQSADAYEVTFEDCTGAVAADNTYVGGGITGSGSAFGPGLRMNRSATAGGHVVNWNGGAIMNCKATAANTSSAGGAAVYMQAKNTDYPYAPTLNINGGAVYGNCVNDDNNKSTATLAGPIQLNSGCKLNIEDGLFYGNSCTDAGTASDKSNGGLIYNGGGTVTINGGYFYDNYAEDFGGLISSTSTVTINGGTFENNYASQGYGGVYYAGGSGSKLYVNGTADNRILFKGNHADQMAKTTTDADGKTTTTYSLGYGGALEVMNGVANIYYADFINNVAGYDGGAIRYGGGSGSTKSYVLENCYFEGNEAKRGGAIYLSTAITSPVNFTSCEFVDNSASDRGGAILYNGGTATNGKSSTATDYVKYATGYTANLTDCTFDGNYGKGYAGALYVANATTLNVSGTEFTNNSSGGMGGVMYTANSTVVLNFDGSTFDGNTANTGGALALDWQKTAAFTGCTFTNNVATGSGGAFYNRGNSSSVITIGGAGDAGCTFTGNKAYTAGAIYGGSSGTNKGTTHIINCTFTENVATNDVSAVRSANYHQMTLTDCTIQNNTSKIYGALHLATANASMTLAGKMVVTDNVSTNYAEYAENADLFYQGYTTDPTINGKLDVSGLTEGSKIGVMVQDSRMQQDAVLTMNGGAAKFDYFYSDSERVLLAAQDGEIVAGKYFDETGKLYPTVQAAVEAAEAAGKTAIKLQATSAETVTLTTLNYIDLNGESIGKVVVPEGLELTLVDTTTDDYACADGYGETEVEGAVKAYVEDTTSGSLKRYVVIKNEQTGKVSAHRVYLAITSKTLRPTGNGVGFKAIFAGDEVVTESGIVYGIQLSGYSDFNQVMAASFDNMEPGALTSTPNLKTVVIYDAITAENQSRWDADLYGRPFLQIGDTTVYGKAVTVNMKAMAAAALASGDQTVIDAVNAMMTQCGVSAN